MERLAFSSLLFYFFFFSVQSVNAFTLNNNVAASFEQDQVKVNVASEACTNLGITNEELLSIAEEAGALYWNRVHSSRLEIVRGSLVSVSGDFRTGAICSSTNPCTPNSALAVSSDILISCNTLQANFETDTVLGVTLPNNVSGTNIVGALILINDRPDNSFNGLSRAEKVAVIAHEMGHAIGLGHASADRNLMYFQSISTRETLGPDDVDGVTYLYPMEQPFGGCGSIAYFKDHNHHEDGSGPSKLFFTLVIGLVLALGMGLIGRTWQKSAPL